MAPLHDPVVPDEVELRASQRAEEDLGQGGSRTNYEDVDARSWGEVKTAIELLDGAHYSELGISRGPTGSPGDSQREDTEDLILGGGEDGRVSVLHVAVAPEGIVSYMAVEPERGDAIETRTIGGQGNDHPARRWVSKDAAVRAVRHFVERGGRAPDVAWEFDFLDRREGPADAE